jgi:20S proteasome alpha/beta subunit
VLGIAGEDYALIASDTRLSEGYEIHSRKSPKAYQLCVAPSRALERMHRAVP